MSGYAMGRALAWALVWAVSGPALTQALRLITVSSLNIRGVLLSVLR